MLESIVGVLTKPILKVILLIIIGIVAVVAISGCAETVAIVSKTTSTSQTFQGPVEEFTQGVTHGWLEVMKANMVLIGVSGLLLTSLWVLWRKTTLLKHVVQGVENGKTYINEEETEKLHNGLRDCMTPRERFAIRKYRESKNG